MRKTLIIVAEILFLIVAFLIGVSIHLTPQSRHAASNQKCLNLKVWYDTYNDLYFNSRLPSDVIVDYGEYNDDNIATTIKMSDGRFHIAFNDKYADSARVAHLFLLHEMCHVRTWSADDQDHGPKWRACMLTLDWLGAHRGLLIDGYEGQK